MATQAFLDKFREGSGALRHLLLLTAARDDGTQSDTLYLADAEVGTLANVVPGQAVGRMWTSAVLDFRPISCPGTFCGTSVPLCMASVTVNADKAVILPAGVGPLLDTTLRKMLQSHVITNATATIYRLFEGQTGTGDAQAFGPFRVLAVELEGSSLTLQLRQRTDWNRPVTLRHVNVQDYPRAPDGTVGMGLGVLLGNLAGAGLRRPWPTRYGSGYHALEHLRSARRVASAMLVDTGRGAGAAVNAAARVLVAGHQCKSLIDGALGTMMYIGAGNKLALLEAGGANIINTDTEAGLKLPDNFDFAWVGLAPAEVLVATNGAIHARHAMNPSDHTFAILDQANTLGYGLARDLVMKLPSLDRLGDPVNMQMVVGYRSSTPLTALKCEVWNDALTALFIGFTLSAKTVPGEAGSTLDPYPGGSGAWPANLWDWGNDRVLRLRFDQAASPAGWARIYFIGLIVQYKPREETLLTERHLGAYRLIPRGNAPSFSVLGVFGSIRGPQYAPYRVPVIEPAVTEMRGKFWLNSQGKADDASGTFTGTAFALIERLPDLLRYLLTTYGGQVAANFETAVGAFGSFTDARATLIDERGNALQYAMPITTASDMMSILATLGLCGMTMPMLSPYDDKWRLVVWRDSPPVTYPWKFSRWDIVDELGPVVEQTPSSSIVTGIRVAYAHNGFRQAYESEVALSDTRSVAGYEYFGLRDQYMTVVSGVNDRLDFKTAPSGVVAATLTAGDYTVQGFCEHLKARMDTAAGIGATDFLVGVGGLIKVNYNDALYFGDAGVGGSVGLRPGQYATMKKLTDGAMAVLNYGANVAGTHASGVRLVTITSGMKTHGLQAGMSIAGTGIPAGTTIVSIDSDTTLTISADTTASFTGTYTITANRTGTRTSGSAVVTMADTGGLTRRMVANGLGFPSGNRILSVDSATQVTMNNNASSSGTDPITFSSSSEWVLDYAPGAGSNEARVTITKLADTRSIVAGTGGVDVERATSGWASLGFSQLLGNLSVPLSPTVLTAHDDRFMDTIWIQSLQDIADYLFQSGTNGQDSAVASRHCGELLGAWGSNDILGSDSTHGSVCFFCPKGVREQALKKTAERYGIRRDVEIEGKAIYDTRAALSLRNRMADLLGKPRTIIRFNTTKAPDIERGHVFEFWPDMDDFSYPGLGSDGKWTGKRFVVVEVAHALGPTSRATTIVAVEV